MLQDVSLTLKSIPRSCSSGFVGAFICPADKAQESSSAMRICDRGIDLHAPQILVGKMFWLSSN